MNQEVKIPGLRGKSYTVSRCLLSDIPFHFEIVKDLVPKDEHKDYQNMMLDCVKTGLAFCIGDSCFIYMKQSKPKFLEAYSFYGKNNPLKVLAMFMYILKEIDKEVMFLKFYPHSSAIINDIKSLLTHTAILRQNSHDVPVLVRCDQLRGKLSAIYKSRKL